MDNITDKLSELLNDPEGIKNLQNMAQSILGGDVGGDAVLPQNLYEKDEEDDLLSNIDVGKMLTVINRVKQNRTDNRTGLLKALKPHLSKNRQERVDKVVKILKIIDILPILQESGLFNF